MALICVQKHPANSFNQCSSNSATSNCWAEATLCQSLILSVRLTAYTIKTEYILQFTVPWCTSLVLELKTHFSEK